ncbi:MAG: hypothetical protein RL685_2735 [Pseudomonadota bacterium]|jgi:hypothetical protein
MLPGRERDTVAEPLVSELVNYDPHVAGLEEGIERVQGTSLLFQSEPDPRVMNAGARDFERVRSRKLLEEVYNLGLLCERRPDGLSQRWWRVVGRSHDPFMRIS